MFFFSAFQPCTPKEMSAALLLRWVLMFSYWTHIVLPEPLDLGSNRNSKARFGFNTVPQKDKIKVSIAVVMPHSMFKEREYKKIIMQSAMELDGSKFEEMFDLSPYLEMVQAIPAPTEVLGKICDQVSHRTHKFPECRFLM